jgi:3-phosphoshikimate 1-carboxyvinyltransferase
MSLLSIPLRGPLTGELVPPGDKSISHRALILASLASGRSEISDLLKAEDVKATAQACRQLGADISTKGNLTLVIGTGEKGLSAPEKPLDMGNSGTAMRLLAGVLAAQPFDSELYGDASLCSRPMRRIVEPLSRMGAVIETAPGGTAPLLIRGSSQMHGIHYEPPVSSAQVKSCVLLCGLFANGTTSVSEPGVSRDHTERMLPVFGVPVKTHCSVEGGAQLLAANIRVPADISSAAFFLVAAAMVPGSSIRLLNVGLNPSRDGIMRVLKAMDADVRIENRRMAGEEPIADIHLRYSPDIHGIDIPQEWIPSLIDELPALMVLAATSKGTMRVRGAAELRVKESDRIAVMASGLSELGVQNTVYEDGIDITGGPVTGGVVDGEGDHRCAMSFCILGQVAQGSVTVQGAKNINTSYPEFSRHLQQLGGQVEKRKVTLNKEGALG